jgi:hypothetical protein
MPGTSEPVRRAPGHEPLGGAAFGALLLQGLCAGAALAVLAVALAAGTWWGRPVTSADRLDVWRGALLATAITTALPTALLLRNRRFLRIEAAVAAALAVLYAATYAVAAR